MCLACRCVLDAPKALIVQPDANFVSNDRLGIVRDQVWGAPDLVVEVISPRTAAYDSRQKLGWFKTYGVRECWLITSRTTNHCPHALEGRRPSKVAYGQGTPSGQPSTELKLRVTDVLMV